MSERRDARRSLSDLLLVGALGGLLAAGCSGIQPEPDIEGGGDVQSPTQEQDALREDEERVGDRDRR